MSTYTAEADALEKRYWETVGWALQYGIKVYRPGSGGQMRCLGDLQDEVRDHQARMGDGWSAAHVTRRSSILDGLVQVYCRNGHAVTLWGGSPMRAKSGETVRWWGSPFYCHCGAECRGGGWR
jgi:hypothetical protein